MVMGIIAILTSLSVLGFKSIVGDTTLTGAGNKLSQIFAVARQEAITKNTLVAVVLLTSQNFGNAQYRTFSVWELSLPTDGTPPTSSNWIQTSKWEALPIGIVIDNSNAQAPTAVSSFLQSSTFNPALPSMTYLGQSVNPLSDCAVQIFLPSGRLNPPPIDPAPCTLKLVEGVYSNSALTYLHTTPSNSQPSNYVTYIFSTATGEPKITRP